MNFENNKICKMFSIKYPVIQGGMVWVSGGKLAAAVSNAGGLGLIGAGSMKPELLKQHILKCHALTDKPFGVNIPLLYKDADKQIQTALENNVKIFFTSAGSPKKYTQFLKDNNCKVVHVTSNPLLAKKCEDSGVDAIVAEGFEAGGHNGKDELTTMVLIPQVCDNVSIPVIAAGGIGDDRQMKAAFCLGAQAVQIGSRFAATIESSAHSAFKQAIIESHFSSTKLVMKKSVPVRLLDNPFSQEIQELENSCASNESILAHLGKGRAKAGMLDGDLINGELEIGQNCSMFKEILSVQDVFTKILKLS